MAAAETEQTYVSVHAADFDIAELYAKLQLDNSIDGAVATFLGCVRDNNQGAKVNALTLEHYPGMTEKSLHGIIAQAREKWHCHRVVVVHRVGRLLVGDNIVFVGVASTHRGDAFAACEFIMDYLKTQAPFWKKEETSQGERWIEAKQSDSDKAASWDPVRTNS